MQRREPAVEIRCVRDVGRADWPDVEVLNYAATHGLIVLSHDVNTMPVGIFARIVTAQPMPGVILVHQLAPRGRVIDDLILVWTASTAEDWEGMTEYLPYP